MSSYAQFIRAQPRFLAFGFLLTLFSSFGQTFFISLFGGELRDAFGLSHTNYGLTYSVATLCSGLTIIFVGKKVDTVDLQRFTLMLCGGMLAACVLLASATHVAMLAIAFFLLRLCGQGLLSHTSSTSMSRYFDKQRGKALSIAGLGYPLGEAILPSLVVVALAALGWRQTWFAVAACVACVLVPLVLLFLRGHKERHAAHVAQIEARGKVSGKHSTVGRQWTRREVVKDLRFYLYLPGVMAPGFIVTGIFFHQGHLIESKDWTATWFAACFVAFAGAQVLSSLIAGPLVDRLGAARIMPVFLAPLALSLVVLASGTSPETAIYFLALFGVTAGLGGPIVGSMWAEVYGTEHLGAIRAMATAIMVFGTAGSPVLFGKLLDIGVTMESICWTSCGYVLISMVLTVVALKVRAPELARRAG